VAACSLCARNFMCCNVFVWLCVVAYTCLCIGILYTCLSLYVSVFVFLLLCVFVYGTRARACVFVCLRMLV
jgi:hypothetical protein